MSYKYSVLSDSPAACWDLNLTTTGTATKKYIGGSMTSGTYTNTPILIDYVKSASSYFFSASYASPPLVSNASSAMFITDSNQYVIKNDMCDTFYQNYENTSFSMEFFFSFDKSFDGSGYTKNSASQSSYFDNNKLIIMRIVNNSSEIGSIYYDYNKNMFVFSLNTVNNQSFSDAYFIPTNLDGIFQIVAIYDKGGLSLIVNTINGVQGFIDTNNLFDNYSKSNETFFVFEGTSLNTANGFFINNVSIYPYVLSAEKIKKHMMMAFYTSDIEKFSHKNDVSYFETIDQVTNFEYQMIYSGNDFLKDSKIFNLAATTNGLNNKQIDSLQSYELYGGSATANSGSVSFTASGAALFPSFYALTDSSTYTITMQFNCSSATDINVFSIPFINGKDYIYCVLNTSSGATLKYYNSSTNSSSTMATISTSLSLNTWYNLAFSTSNSEYKLYLNSLSASALNSTFFDGYLNNSAFSLNNSSKIMLANFEQDIKASSSELRLKNIGAFNYYVTDFTGFDFTENKMLMAKIKNNFVISQYGYWQSIIPSTLSQPASIVSSKMVWETMDNCLVQTSIDEGATWQTAQSDSYIPYITPNSSSGNISDLFVRVILNTDNTVSTPSQYFNNLNISLYGNINLSSDDAIYKIKPAADVSGQHSYIKNSKSAKIMTRPKNLGLHFDQENGAVTGYAEISSASTSYAIDFWWSLSSFNVGSDGYIFDTSNANGPGLYIKNADHKFSFNALKCTIYVNGVAINSNFIPTVNDYYHIAIVFANPLSSSDLMYLNGKYQNSSNHAHGTYGNIYMWNEAPTATDILLKYKSYISNNIASVVDDGSSSTYIFPDLTKVFVQSYKIG